MVLNLQIPEDRVPWEPQKQSAFRKRSKSLPVYKSQATILPTIEEKTEKSNSAKNERVKGDPSVQSENRQKQKNVHINKELAFKTPQSITISRGSLRLAVNFPSDATVKVKTGRIEKQITQGLCNCKSLSTVS